MNNDFVYQSVNSDEDMEELKRSLNGQADSIKRTNEEMREAAKTRFVSLYEVHERLGFTMEFMTNEKRFYLDNFGWGGSEPGLHQATMRDLHPDHCPCCGRSWDD